MISDITLQGQQNILTNDEEREEETIGVNYNKLLPLYDVENVFATTFLYNASHCRLTPQLHRLWNEIWDWSVRINW